MTGLSDFREQSVVMHQIHRLRYNSTKGTIFKQPFDSLNLTASGSLDGIGIDSFLMEHHKETWRAVGAVGFYG